MTATRPGSLPVSLSSQPRPHQHGVVIQEFGKVKQFPIWLSCDTRMPSSEKVNKVLADTQVL